MYISDINTIISDAIQKRRMTGYTKSDLNMRQGLGEVFNLDGHIPLQVKSEVPSTTKRRRKTKHLQEKGVSETRREKDKDKEPTLTWEKLNPRRRSRRRINRTTSRKSSKNRRRRHERDTIDCSCRAIEK